MDDVADRLPHHPTTVTPPGRRSRRWLVGLALPLVPGVLVLGSYQARRALIGEREVCIVTRASLAQRPSPYSGSDHPLDPQVGDSYIGTSGCVAFETICVRRIELLGTRVDCSS
ncbi:hypothetical protein KSP35_05415 [Aquihabitans sp. G128]|uniref:hypothetical protein n=1 Tax=Aquihabitans sp. G128 TaxID=2849779 RepID=UPI001C21BD36|nr:hypothetical protein [Aquihabitans sp. G128]QXC62247.1 hypothetical protein KSP35_05415 [Aquihabitans sp. G128]